MTFEQLDPRSREEAITGFANDVCCVVAHVLVDARPDEYLLNAPGGLTLRTTLHVLDLAGDRPDEPIDIAALTRVLGWVLATTQWNERRRPLSDSERCVKDAAWRLSDAIHGPRATTHDSGDAP